MTRAMRLRSMCTTFAGTATVLLLLYVVIAFSASFLVTQGYANEVEERIWIRVFYPIDWLLDHSH